MIRPQVEEVFATISERMGIPIYYYDDRSDDGFHGITDNEVNYAYVRLREGNDPRQFSISEGFDYGCSGALVSASYWFVMHLESSDQEHNLNVARSNLSKIADIKITDGSIDTEGIYKEQTGSDLMNTYTNLICLWFDISLIANDCCGDELCLNLNNEC